MVVFLDVVEALANPSFTSGCCGTAAAVPGFGARCVTAGHYYFTLLSRTCSQVLLFFLVLDTLECPITVLNALLYEGFLYGILEEK